MTEQAHIVYLLWRHLNDYKWFEIPEIGLFEAHIENTYIDFEQETIFPARLNIQFIPGQHSRLNQQLAHLTEEYGYEESQISDQLQALGQTALQQLESNGPFEFPPFGQLHKTGGKLQFVQSANNLHQDFYDEGPLSIVPAKSTFQPVEEFSARPTIEKPKKSSEMRWLLTVLTILWIIFLSLLLGPKSCNSNQQKESFPEATDSSLILTAEDSLVLKSLLETADTSYDSLYLDSDMLIDSSQSEILIQPNNIDSLNQAMKHKDCIIIIGSFIKKSNANRLAAKVTSDNYQLYEGQHGRFNRVGIKFNCFDRKLEEVLIELKARYHPDAWALKIE